MYTALEDIKLETVDFKWIKETTKISHLKRAIRLIEMDGDYFKELKDACYERIGEIDPTQKRGVFDNKLKPEFEAQIKKELEQWEMSMEVKQKTNEIFQQEKKDIELDPETYFDTENVKVNNKKEAESQRVKGNEAIRSKDFDEALKYYTRSLELDSQMYQTYGNRALVYIKTKDFQKALSDCDSALRLNPKYTKAFHRKAKALIGLKNRIQAYKALQEALKIEPENSEINSELKELRQEMNQDELRQIDGSQSKFRKIAIEEDSDEEQEMEEK